MLIVFLPLTVRILGVLWAAKSSSSNGRANRSLTTPRCQRQRPEQLQPPSPLRDTIFNPVSRPFSQSVHIIYLLTFQPLAPPPQPSEPELQAPIQPRATASISPPPMTSNTSSVDPSMCLFIYFKSPRSVTYHCI